MRSYQLLVLGFAALLGACSSEGGETSSTASGGSGGGSGGDGGASSSATSTGSGGAPSSCDGPEDCTSAELCITPTCEQGTCGTEEVPAGTVVADAVVGDCKSVQCDGSGSGAPVSDPKDTPDEHNPCTVGSCEGGTPKTTPVANGAACGSGSATVCAAGECTGCKNDGECPPPPTCHSVSCSGGGANKSCQYSIAVGKVVSQDPDGCMQQVCDAQGIVVTEPRPDGTSCGQSHPCAPSGCSAGVCVEMVKEPAGTKPTSLQTTQDCKDVLCDGEGDTVVVPANDPQLGSTTCRTYGCANGTNTTTNAPSGTTCGAGLVCNGSGSCVAL